MSNTFSDTILGLGGKSTQPQKNKQNMNILRQEKLIAQKKKEIEEKLAQQAKINAQTTNRAIQRYNYICDTMQKVSFTPVIVLSIFLGKVS